MSWPQSEFDHERGVVTLLQTLAKSPLVRRSFPNAAATMTQYFAFRKYPNVPISSFLVRAYEDLQEALVRLREERSGLDPSRFFSVQKMIGMDGDVGMMVLNVVM
jgi:hypothetical protein